MHGRYGLRRLALLAALVAVLAASAGSPRPAAAFGFGPGAPSMLMRDADFGLFGGRRARAPPAGHYYDAYGRRAAPRRECAVASRPLRDTRVEVRAGAEPGAHVITAHLPGVASPTVRVARPGVLELRAARPVPRQCLAHGDRDELVRQYRVHEALETGDLDARLGRDGVLTVRVPARPGRAPRHCLNVHRPMADVVRAEVRRHPASGGFEVRAALPPGVGARHASVSIPRPGTLLVAASRPVPRGCEAWSAGEAGDSFERRYDVDPRLRESDLSASVDRRTGVLSVVVPHLPPADQGPPAPAPAREPEQAPPAAKPAEPAVSLDDIKRALAELAAEYLEGAAAAGPGAAAAAEPASREGDLENEDGSPRWYHTPLGAGVAPGAVAAADDAAADLGDADELWVDLGAC